MTTQLTYQEWRKKYPDVENIISCPFCYGGWDEEEDDVCSVCDGSDEYNDLRGLYKKLYRKDHDRLIWWVFGLPMFSPGCAQ